uniref:K Homology domain-containing protein n=1 Tax=Alexandrium monilatum TaxID=311494 RepID=A0A7S4Q136_9DINO
MMEQPTIIQPPPPPMMGQPMMGQPMMEQPTMEQPMMEQPMMEQPPEPPLPNNPMEQWPNNPGEQVPNNPGEQAPGGEQPEEPVDDTPKVKDSMNYPRNHMKSILGYMGNTIREIRQNGADVWIKPFDDHIEVYMHGTGEQVEAAKKHVILVAQPVEEESKNDWNDWGKDDWRKSSWDRGGWNKNDWGRDDRYNRRDRDNRENETMDLELSAFGCIVGPGGAKIKEVRQQSGAHVSIDKLDTYVQVKIAGSAEQVASAKKLINDLVSGGGTSKGAEKSETLDFEAGVMGNIIGSGGKRINDVRKQSGADVNVKKNDDRCEVIISGSSDAVETAKSMILTFVNAARQGVSPHQVDYQQSTY